MDSKQYAAVSLDVKNINIGNANIPNDWKGATIHSITRDFHVGVSYVDTGTFEFVPPFAIPQTADLGPSRNFALPGSPLVAKAAKYTMLIFTNPQRTLIFIAINH
jgi:hypothetical protein